LSILEEPNKKSLWISEGLIIASAPIAAYVLAMTFVSSYLDYFKIPAEFSSLNIMSMFSIASQIFTVAVIAPLIYLAVFSLVKHAESPVTRRIRLVLPFAIMFAFRFLLFFSHVAEWIGSLVVLLLLIFTFFYLPARGRKPELSYSANLNEFDNQPRSSSVPILISMVSTELGGRIATIAFWAWFSIVTVSGAGRFYAMTQRSFLVPSGAPSSVVISSFGDTLVVAPFDRTTHEVDRSFFILKKGEDPKLLLRWEFIGPLHLKSPPTTAP
jgi:hypothetical protein